MNLDRLRRLQRRERREEELCDLDDGFFEEVGEYLDGLQEGASEDPEALDELRNARRAFRGLFDRRERKILGRMSASVELDVAPGALTSEEREFFEKLESAVEEHRRLLKEPAQRNNKGGEEEEGGSSDLAVVRILEGVDDFVGTDGVTYSLEEGDVVSLPGPSAEVLLNSGAAEEIEE